MTRAFFLAALGAALTTLAGCVTANPVDSVTPNALAPTAAGIATPGLLAPLEGGLVGRMNGVGLARADVIEALESEYRALEYTPPGDIVVWQSGNGASSGQVVASQPYRVGSQDCRQYMHTLTPSGAGAPQVARGTACRNDDGSWTLLS